jgi:hypothetical protein
MFATGMLAFTLATNPGVGRAADSVVVRRDIEYRSSGVQPLRLDLYSPTRIATRLPLVVIFNSGSLGGRAQPESVNWARRVAAAGMSAVTYEALRESAVADFDSVARFWDETSDGSASTHGAWSCGRGQGP